MFLIRSKEALSIATGSVEAKIPISLIFGTGAEAPAQSQLNEILAITLIYAIPFLSLKYFTIAEAASAIEAVKFS